MIPLRVVRGSRYRRDAVSSREAYVKYFNREGKVPWHLEYVRRTPYQQINVQKV